METLSIGLSKSIYGSFALDNIQIFYDYIHNHEMMKVEAGPQSQQAIKAASI